MRSPRASRWRTRAAGRQHPGPSAWARQQRSEVVAEVVDALVVPAQGGEQVGAHQGAGAGHHEHVAHRVVLLLVELAHLHVGGEHAGLVGAHAHLEQAGGVVPVDQLGADDAGVGAERLFHQAANGVGLQGDVVVHEQVEGGALHQVGHVVGGGAVPGVVVQSAHVGVGQHGVHPVGGIRLPGGVHHQHAQVGVGLVGQALQGLVEPGAGIVGDQHHDHRGDHGG